MNAKNNTTNMQSPKLEIHSLRDNMYVLFLKGNKLLEFTEKNNGKLIYFTHNTLGNNREIAY